MAPGAGGADGLRVKDFTGDCIHWNDVEVVCERHPSFGVVG